MIIKGKAMTDKEYIKYTQAVQTGLKILRKHGNWSVPPWMIKKYGFAAVEEDLRMRAGKQYRLRKSIYMHEGSNRQRVENTYYIFEIVNV